MDSIKKENAYDVPDMELPRLKRNLQNAAEWMSQANSLSAFCGMLLNSPAEAFWSTVVYSKATLQALDSFLESFPRPYCKQDMALYLDANADVRRMCLRLYQQVLVFLLRIIANTDKLDLKSFSLYTSFHKVLTADRLVKTCAIYASNNKAALTAVIGNLLKTLPGLANELNEYAKNANQRLRRIEAGILDLVTAAENDRVARSVSHATSMDELLDSGRELCLSIDAFLSVHELKELGSWSSTMNALPAFVDTVSTALSDLALMNFAAVFSAGHFRTFLKKRSLLLQAAVHLFKRFYTCGILSDRDRFQLIYGSMEHKTFLLRFNDEAPVRDEMAALARSGVCVQDHVNSVAMALDAATSEAIAEITNRLQKQKMLKFLGRPENPQIEEAIKNLQDLVPQYSRQQIHLCLRNYGYDVQKATHALMEPKEMPIQLRILLRQKASLDHVDKSGMRLPTVADDSDPESEASDDEGAIARTEPARATASYLALTPITPSEEESRARAAANKLTDEQRKTQKTAKKLEKLMERCGGIVDLSELQTVVESIDKASDRKAGREEVVELGGKKLIKHDKARSIPQEPSAADKAAIRESTLRYKYELSDEDDEDGRYDLEARYAAQVGQSGRFNRGDVPVSTTVNRAIYDDEYDDSYDDREFAMDTAAAKVEDEQVTESVTRRAIPKSAEPPSLSREASSGAQQQQSRPQAGPSSSQLSTRRGSRDEPAGGKKMNQARKDEPKRGGNGAQKGRGGPAGSGPPKQDGGGQKGHGGPRRESQRDGQKKEQRAEPKKEQMGGGQQQDQRRDAHASGSGNRVPPSGAPRQQGQQAPKREWTASKPKPPVKKQNSGEKQPSQAPTQSTSGLSIGPPPGMEPQQSQPPAKKPTEPKPSSSGGGGGPDQRQRQQKERNKGKDKQKGADRKARGGMF